MSEVSRINGRRAICGSFHDPVRSALFVLREHQKSFHAAYQGYRPATNGDSSLESLIIVKRGKH